MAMEPIAFNASYLTVMCLGLGASAWLHHLLLSRRGQRRRMAWLTLLLGLPMAAILAKLFCVVFRFDLFNVYGASALIQANPEQFSFVGGCLGFVLGAVFAALISRERVLPALDAYAAPACLMVAVARAAEGFLGDLGIGDYVDAEAFQFFPVAVRDNWGGWALAIYMLAALAALACALCAGGWLERYRLVPGLCFERTVVGLCAGQIMFEILRVISIVLSFVHTEQVLCALAMVIIIIRRCVLLRKRFQRRAWLPVGIAVIFVFVLWEILLQFAMDKTDYLIDPLPLSEAAMDWLKANLAPVCYSLMALGVAGLLIFEWLSARAYLKCTAAGSEQLPACPDLPTAKAPEPDNAPKERAEKKKKKSKH